MTYHLIGLAVMLAWAGFGPGPANAATPNGGQLASACTACHGPGGQSRGAVPSLAGMDTATFIQRMQYYRNGNATIMNRIAPAYDDAQIAALAAYFTARESAGNERPHASQ